jgi:hypothetical protein
MVAYLFARDKGCVAAKLDRGHQCATRFRQPHSSTDLSKMTIDHVKEHARMGVRAESDDPRRMVTLCGFANNEGWASAHRKEERAYLRGVEP